MNYMLTSHGLEARGGGGGGGGGGGHFHIDGDGDVPLDRV